jgi:hypothetical protein
MAGDGVSLQTNISQLGNVAKTQSRAQQGGAVDPDQARQLKKEDVAPLQKVRETGQAEKKQVDPDARRPRRRGRGEDEDADGDPRETVRGDEDEDQDRTPGSETATSGVGGLVDTKA